MVKMTTNMFEQARVVEGSCCKVGSQSTMSYRIIISLKWALNIILSFRIRHRPNDSIRAES